MPKSSSRKSASKSRTWNNHHSLSTNDHSLPCLFLDPNQTSLKICGVTLAEDAQRLISTGVDAMGINFWPHSKRYLSPEAARSLLMEASGRITRVGVFVNAEASLPRAASRRRDSSTSLSSTVMNHQNTARPLPMTHCPSSKRSE